MFFCTRFISLEDDNLGCLPDFTKRTVLFFSGHVSPVRVGVPQSWGGEGEERQSGLGS